MNLQTGRADVILEAARETPVVMRPQVVVSGGGPAGFAAAVAAARQGADTLLIERNSFLGGAATAGLMAYWAGRDRALGLAVEVIDRLVAAGGAVTGRMTSFDPETLKQVSLDMIEEAGGKLLLYSSVTTPVMENGRVRGVIVENKSGRQAILGDVVIDATGDADVAARAGAPVVKGRERDGKTRPITLVFRMCNVDVRRMVEYVSAHPDQFSPIGNVVDLGTGEVRISGFFDIVEQGRQRGEVDKDCHYLRFEGVDVKRGTMFVNATRVYDLYGADAFELSKSESEARKQMTKLVAFIVNRIPGCESSFLVEFATNIGVRETCRIIGEYIFDEKDIVEGSRFKDVIVVESSRQATGFDIHSPDRGEGAVTDLDHRSTARGRLLTFQIPYRCLLPQKVEGLLVVGRAMSTSHSGDGFTRPMLPCMSIGQAAGVAAAMAAKSGVSPRQVDIGALQKVLVERGVLASDALA